MSTKTVNILISALFLLSAAVPVRSQFCPDVHEILALSGLPRGLLPDTAGNFSLTNGEFKVELETDSCQAQQLGVAMRYDERTVSGKLSPGKLDDIKGILLVRTFTMFFPGGAPVTQIHY